MRLCYSCNIRVHGYEFSIVHLYINVFKFVVQRLWDGFVERRLYRCIVFASVALSPAAKTDTVLIVCVIILLILEFDGKRYLFQ